jgi:hypothetical protein
MPDRSPHRFCSSRVLGRSRRRAPVLPHRLRRIGTSPSVGSALRCFAHARRGGQVRPRNEAQTPARRRGSPGVGRQRRREFGGPVPEAGVVAARARPRVPRGSRHLSRHVPGRDGKADPERLPRCGGDPAAARAQLPVPRPGVRAGDRRLPGAARPMAAHPDCGPRRTGPAPARRRRGLDVAEVSIGYRLRQQHLGLVAWIPEPTSGGEGLARLDRLTAAITEAVGCRRRPLIVPCDQAVAWSWLPLDTRTAIPWEALRTLVEDHDRSARLVARPGPAGGRPSSPTSPRSH